ncbi:nuclear hormone receptor HR96, partial [Biomphalaria glabrata]
MEMFSDIADLSSMMTTLRKPLTWSEAGHILPLKRIGLKSPNTLYLADFTALNRLYLADSKYLKAGLYTAFQTVSRYLEENIFLHWHSSKISLYHFQH